MKKILFLVILISILSINISKADIFTSNDARGHKEVMRDLDMDRDGAIDASEINSHVNSTFSRFDTDGDDCITKDEMLEVYGGKVQSFDIDGDGEITKYEMKKYRKINKLKK